MTDEPMLPQAWDLPVVRALDAIKSLPGLDSDHVEFDTFRFSAPSASGPTQSAMIHAYQPVTSARFTVKFTVRGSTYDVQSHDGQPLTVSGVADLLHLPLASADRAVTLLKAGLSEALRIYNEAHAPAPHHEGRPATIARAREPWPFAARPGTDESSDLNL
ncbi:hypothetical protein [Promicromonospora iranensis]|uniref:YbaB/EbfC DNA-binding family protein n=1 Tax=Promicromonospora iranensis TaxID=1105144 RepID=A0ABU2CIT4_9MICO|nr:hypothetical protein [Promicromonospora iranensis]MDR7381252.1 hypothetical protein [Promicromonospora iranensis]